MNTITVYCGKCGEKLSVKAVDAGGVMRCTKCRVRIPIPSSNLDRPQIHVFCPKCGARLRGWPEEAGKQVECRRCKKTISLPEIKKPEKTRRESGSTKKDRKKDSDSDVYSLVDEEDEEEIEKEEVKIEPVKKRRGADGPILSFSDDDLSAKKSAKPKRRDKGENKDTDEDEEDMISFDEFLVDDAPTSSKKKRRPSRKDEKKPRKPKLSPDEQDRATRDTDALPPSTVGKKRTPPKKAAEKTLVIECKDCGMRLVFRNGKKPIPNAICPACGEELVW